MNLSRAEILSQALEARDAELLGYQINIDNYALAITEIDQRYPDNDDLAIFAVELQERLDEERRQQLRCRVIRDVIAAQLTDLEATA